MTDENEEQPGYACTLPFWTDTDAYTDRDREMFCAGFEFCMVAEWLEHEDAPLSRPVHRENESRIRMAAGKLGRKCSLTPCPEQDDPGGTWSYMEIAAR